MPTIPWTYDPRADTRTTNVRIGMWLFLASEAMLFASLLSAYVLLRAGATSWPDNAGLLDARNALVNTAILVLATIASGWLPRLGGEATRRAPMVVGAVLAAGFVVLKILEYRAKLAAGLAPSTNLLLACWFTLTAVHAAHVAAGAVATLWVATRNHATRRQGDERLRALRLYWGLVDLVWLALLIAFYAF
jgi:heme/copper-type cytochrome/quinol oxidase subunit 3